MSENAYRQLPAVGRVLDLTQLAAARQTHSHAAVVAAVRQELDLLRSTIADGTAASAEPSAVADRALARLSAAPHLREVINGTGIVLHTNLGRSPLCEDAARAAYAAARGYLNLELDLSSGKRSSRQNPIRADLCRLTGAEAATAVNNCAAATVLALRAIAAGKEVVVSRGQLVEIGGSFRIPDILAVSGATLREVGTTNITRDADYERAVGPNTGAILRVHASNYRMTGFTKSVGIDRLVAIGRRHTVPVIDDVGSGASIDLSPLGFSGEPHVGEGIRAGADLVLFSGDKLLGGPQSGLIAGKAVWIEKMEADPLMRAFRLDKMSLAALEATLRKYRDPPQAVRELPTLRMMFTPVAELRPRAERFADRLRTATPTLAVEVQDDVAYVGGGSLPDQALPTVVVAVRSATVAEAELAQRLRVGTPAVLGRVQGGKVLLDLRTVFEWQEDALLQAVLTAMA